MDALTIIFIAVGLAMDAFAVSVTEGFLTRNICLRDAVRMPVFFGLFQAFMPVVGWSAGTGLRKSIQAFDHWIAFGLLALIGAKMIYESFRFKSMNEAGDVCDRKLATNTLLVLSVATSIDALAVGFSISILNVGIIAPALVIGAVTFVISLIGIYLGNRFGHFFERKIEAVGGLVLIAIGVKILVEHIGG